MGKVAKYNLFKGISTLATLGTPIVTLLCTSEMFVHRPETAISATGIFAILITILLLKDKIAENFKMPGAFVLSTVVFVLILLIENIIQPMKAVALATMIASGIDEISFKRLYKSIELQLPENAKAYKHVGFIFTSSKKLLGENNG
jgi:hypothetical protein